MLLKTHNLYKVGDRIRVICNFAGFNHLSGKTGTIVFFAEDRSCYDLAVEFDEEFDGGHNIDARISSYRGRWGMFDEIELHNEWDN